MRQITALAAALCMLAASSSTVAQEVYKWKDAKGVTHYSERPPAQGAYSSQATIRDPANPASASATAAADNGSGNNGSNNAPSDSRCTSARNALSSLLGKNPPQADTDNDGKADRPLSEAERASQVELNRSTLKAYNCSDA